MASLTYTATDEYGNDITVRLPDWTGQPLLATTAAPPDGTLVADGSEVSRASYPELFAKIGTTYGEGDGVTTFALPDWRDEFPRFSGSGRAVGSKQSDAIRNIVGQFGSILYQKFTDAEPDENAGPYAYGVFSNTQVEDFRMGVQQADQLAISAYGDQIKFDASTVVPTADENRPRNIAFLPCIIYV